MKIIPSPLAAHYLLECTTLAIGILIQRMDEELFGLTTADIIVPIGSVMYIPGLRVNNVDIMAGLAVDNLELLLLDDTSLVTRPDALSGIWRNASFQMFEYNYLSPTDGINPLTSGTFGEITLGNGSIKVELRGLQQGLQQTVGAVSSKTCRARLGEPLGTSNPGCGVNLATYTVAGTLTTASNKQVFVDTARTETDDWFAEGLFKFTSGVCAGLSQKIKIYAADTFTLSLPMILQPSPGDSYIAIAGCRKRLPEDCLAKFNNVLNFQGEYHLPGMDALTKPIGTL